MAPSVICVSTAPPSRRAAFAETDTGNEGIPYESPSNKTVHIDGLCDDDGNTINLTYNQALVVDAAGICTFLNFMGGWTAWGNHTACYPKSTDVKDYFIPLSRMFDYVSNTPHQDVLEQARQADEPSSHRHHSG